MSREYQIKQLTRQEKIDLIRHGPPNMKKSLR